MQSEAFNEQLHKLNPKQREAVEATEGPVMVIAGPGTGKTQILALRIGNIIQKAGVTPDSILCLTFTNSGVQAMRERLAKIIGAASTRVFVATFHKFAGDLLNEFHEVLDLEKPPTLLDEKDTVLLYDELLEGEDWEYLRPRNGGEHNFGDLKSVISLLKRERMKPSAFLFEIEREIEQIKSNPESISSRGPSKGQMKVTEREKIERLERTKEIAWFYELYESRKKERNLADYDDMLEHAVSLVKKSEEVRDTVRERYLYVLVDEHQDSSGVQNEFLEAVWGGTERPNIFVVGDDRQLIYGFGGASLSHFEKFRDTFPGTQLIGLTHNYRSTQNILDLSGTLLASSLMSEALVGKKENISPIALVEASFPRDEIIAAGLAIKKKIAEGVSPDECAILVPKQAQARTAARVLRDLGLQVAALNKSSFFSLPETESLLSVLTFLGNPYAPATLAALILNNFFGIPYLEAHRLLRTNGRRLSLEHLIASGGAAEKLARKLQALLAETGSLDPYSLIQKVAADIFFKEADSNSKLLTEIEVVRTLLHLALREIEKNHKLQLPGFLSFIERMQSYGEDISLATFSSDKGVKVMTLHGSKGLEYDFVWIAHLDEGSLMSGKRLAVTLPESIKEKIQKKDELTARRELYVAMTRAKRFLTLSFAASGYAGNELSVAKIISELPQEHFVKRVSEETESEILHADSFAYVSSNPVVLPKDAEKEIVEFVRKEYPTRPVSVTHLNNFFACPWQWYFRNFLQLPEPESESLEFGNLVHVSIEALLKGADATESGLEVLLDEKLDLNHIYEERMRRRFKKDAQKILIGFVKNHLAQFAQGDSERKIPSYRDPQTPNIEVTGKIDLIETLSGDTLAVTDFKTGKVKKRSEIEKISEEGRMSDLTRQLSMYSYLLLNAKDGGRVSLSRLFFLEAEEGDKDKMYECLIEPEKIEMLRSEIHEYDTLLQSGEWTKRECSFKPMGKRKECEYCAMIKKFQ